MTTPPPLPVDAVLAELVTALRPDAAPRSVVLEAPTGAGKTTRVPPALLALGDGRVVMTEPRRVAARAAARRIATEQGVRLGDEVGYHVRFDRKAGRDTRLVVATEGIVVRMLQRDPFLEGIGALIFDEFHERSVDTDLALALAREIQRDARPDLAIVVMSATLDPAPIADWLGGATIVRSEGRTFPVKIAYPDRPDDRPLDVRMAAKIREIMRAPPGDILAFLPGYREIHRVAERLSDEAFQVDRLHGTMDAAEQDRVLRPPGAPRVILSTNVAESSLTIPGVRAVVDSGWARVMRFDAASGFDRLATERISLANAAQRAGRAGREAPGICHRLWGTEVDYRLANDLEAEIHRVDLAPLALQLLTWGVGAPAEFGWFEPPDPSRWEDAMTLLSHLGLVSDGRVTSIGEALCHVPLHPRLARVVDAGFSLGVGHEAALAAAALSERDVLTPARHDEGKRHISGSDVLDRVEAVESNGERPSAVRRRYRHAAGANARRVAKALARGFTEIPRTEPRAEALAKAVLAGFPDRVAIRRSPGGSDVLVSDGKGAVVHPACAVSADDSLVVAVRMTQGRRSEPTIDIASRVEEGWLDPSLIQSSVEVRFDRDLERVTSARVRRYLALVLDERAAPLPQSPDVEACLLEAAQETPESALDVDDRDFARMRSRVGWLRYLDPELGLPALDEGGLRELLPLLCHGRSSFKELRAINLCAHLRSVIPYRLLQALDELAPESLEIPSGRRATLTYTVGSPPILAARIQELFGLVETPRVGGGKVQVLVHLLAPNMRPQQITSDLRSFWESGYAEVRKELRARYPKHSWPEDPLRAKAQRRPGRRRR